MENKFEEPHTEWVHETAHDTLVVYLPGYKKEQLKVQVTTAGKLRISGERTIGENESIRFRQEFPVPAYCDGNGITATFKGGVLNIKLPKFNASEAEKLTPPPPVKEPLMSEAADKEEEKFHEAAGEVVAEEKPKVQEEKVDDVSSDKGNDEGARGAGEMGYGGVQGRIAGAGDVKQVLDDLVREIRSPRRVWNLVVALFMVVVLVLNVRRAYLSLFGEIDDSGK